MKINTKKIIILVAFFVSIGLGTALYLVLANNSKIDELRNILALDDTKVFVCEMHFEKSSFIRLLNKSTQSKKAGSYPMSKLNIVVLTEGVEKSYSVGFDSKDLTLLWLYEGNVDLIGSPMVYLRGDKEIFKMKESCSIEY